MPRKPPKKQNRGEGPASYSSLLTFVPYVVNDWNHKPLRYPKSKIRIFASQNEKTPTRAEFALDKILLSLNGGVLKGRYRRQHVINGKWIVDFFFPEVRLAIEVDGSYHHSAERKELDRLKELDCGSLDITLIRIRNGEVFGDRERLVERLRHGWREAKARKNQVIGLPYRQPFAAQAPAVRPTKSQGSTAPNKPVRRTEDERRRDDAAWGISGPSKPAE